MAANGASVSQPLIPVFDGNKYQFWSVKMKTLFKSQDLWEFVDDGFQDPDEAIRLKENKKKDAKALFFLQQAVHENIFPRIMNAATSKEAWLILQKEFQGDKKIVTIKLQTLRREFETATMKTNESVQEYLSRISTLVSQMQAYGERSDDETVVAKVLRSLTPRFDHVVAAIEESKDLAVFSFDELMGSLQAHEARINRTDEQIDEKAIHIKEEAPTAERGIQGYGRQFPSRGRGRGVGRGQGRGRGQIVQCHHCKRFGHVKANC